MGVASNGMLLIVVHTWQDLSPTAAYVRIISARQPSTREARFYEEDL